MIQSIAECIPYNKDSIKASTDFFVIIAYLESLSEIDAMEACSRILDYLNGISDGSALLIKLLLHLGWQKDGGALAHRNRNYGGN